MAIDLARLAGQGRAFSGTRAWETEELDALIALERERGIGRLRAADYIRNGILTLEDYDAAVKAKFVPQTTEGALAAAEASLKDNKFATDTEKLAKEADKESAKVAKEAAKAAKAQAKADAKAAKEAAK